MIQSSAKTSSRCVFDLSEDGHRNSYFDVFSKVLNFERVVNKSLRATCAFNTAVFLTFDDYFLKFAIECLLRSIRGQKSFGLSLRLEAIIEEPNLTRRFKCLILRILRALPNVEIIALSSPELVPGIERVSSDWIDDLQLWDLEVNSYGEPSNWGLDFLKEIEHSRGMKKVILALGRQDWQKGVSFFCELAENPRLKTEFLFVMAGPIRNVDDSIVERLNATSVIVADEKMTESDLVALYQCADYIWTCYDPSYNVNSGIFGRALQLGKVPIVRQGSILSRLLKSCGTGLELVYGDIAAAEQKILEASFQHFDSGKIPNAKNQFVKVFTKLED